MDLKPGNLVLVKADVFQGKKKIKSQWEDEPCEVVHKITRDIPLYKVIDQHSHVSYTTTNFSLLHQKLVFPCVGICQAWDRGTNPTPVKPTPKGSVSKNMPGEQHGLACTKCQARKTSLEWINRKIQLLPWMSTGVSTEDGWRLQVTCSGSGHLQDCVHLVEG